MLKKTFWLGWVIFASSQSWAVRPDFQAPPPSMVSVGTHYSVAAQLLDKRKYGEAIVAFRSILKNEPRLTAAQIGLAAALAYTGKREEALNLLVQATTEAKGVQRDTLMRRTRVLSCLFLTNKTFQIYQEGLNLVLGKKYRNAKERFEKALSEESSNVEILIRLGQSLVLDEDSDEAIERLSLAKKYNPFEPEAHLWLGRAYFQKNSNQLAVPELRIAHHELPGSEQAAVWLAEALSSSGQSTSALRILNNDIKKWPFHILSLLTAAKIRLQVEQADAQMLWSARKDLQLAMSRLDQYMLPDTTSKKSELSIDLRKSTPEIKAEIQKLLNQVQSKLIEKDAQR